MARSLPASPRLPSARGVGALVPGALFPDALFSAALFSSALVFSVLALGCGTNSKSADAGSGGASASGGSDGSGGDGDTSAGGSDAAGGTASWGAGDAHEGAGGPPPNGLASCASTDSLADLGGAWTTLENAGPDSHGTKYGARPRLVTAPRGDGSFDFAWQTESGGDVLYVSHVAPSDSGYAVQFSLELPSLGQIGGLAIAEDGAPVVATAILESIDKSTTPSEEHRDGILQLVRVDANCGEAYRVNLRTDFDGNTGRLPLYQPYQAGTSRLALGAGAFVLHYAQMTEFDAQVDSRHQIGRYLVGEVATGALSAVVGSISHSFDQRVRFDGNDFVSLALGDASLRGIALARLTPQGQKAERTLYAIKGGDSMTGGGYNNTFTRLGDLRPSATGYVSLFATEHGNERSENVNVSRNLAWVHSPAAFHEIEQPEKYMVTVADTATGNDAADDFEVNILDYWEAAFPGHNRGIVWLTDYDDRLTAHAERPKVVRWGADRFYVLWEKWTLTEFEATYALVVDEWGHTIVPARSLGDVRLSRHDDAFLLDGKAAWLTSIEGVVQLHLVDSALELTSHTL